MNEMVVREEYPYFRTTVRMGTDDTDLLLLLHQLSAGYNPKPLPRNLRVYKMEYILAMNELHLRRFAKCVANVHRQGLHVAFLAQDQGEFSLIQDQYLLNWMQTHCINLQNPELL